MLGCLVQIVNLDDVSIVSAQLVEIFFAELKFTFHFLHLTVVRFVGFLAGEFLMEIKLKS
jgi:hypothetical protein